MNSHDILNMPLSVIERLPLLAGGRREEGKPVVSVRGNRRHLRLKERTGKYLQSVRGELEDTLRYFYEKTDFAHIRSAIIIPTPERVYAHLSKDHPGYPKWHVAIGLRGEFIQFGDGYEEDHGFCLVRSYPCSGQVAFDEFIADLRQDFVFCDQHSAMSEAYEARCKQDPFYVGAGVTRNVFNWDDWEFAREKDRDGTW